MIDVDLQMRRYIDHPVAFRATNVIMVFGDFVETFQVAAKFEPLNFAACRENFQVAIDGPEADTGKAERLPLENPDGHFSFIPGRPDWILNDTYPHGDGERLQTLFVQHLPSGRTIEIGSFPYPESPRYAGQLRCDLHPRVSQDGKLIAFDSAHNGGRQIHLAHISALR